MWVILVNGLFATRHHNDVKLGASEDTKQLCDTSNVIQVPDPVYCIGVVFAFVGGDMSAGSFV